MNNRKIKLKDGEIEGFWIKGERNPCGCGSNCFHEEYDGKILYGVCNACKSDIYEFKYDEAYINNSEWKNKNKETKSVKKDTTDCNKCGMNNWCWRRDMNEDCPTAREILDKFMP